ncbi:MAG: hypothetical protein IJ833_09495 [Lachnospiraceae bacterium]|nr:hypothetical protein [Lachnospiraceae bacterium]
MDKPETKRTIFFNNTFFEAGDIVVIKKRNGSEFKGRICFIDILFFDLDMSEQYNKVEQRFYLEDVLSIRYLSEEKTE